MPRKSAVPKANAAKAATTPAEGEALGAGLYRARDTFFYKGTTLVNRGDTVEAGHPMLDGRLHLFEPFAPTFPVDGPQPLPVAEAPAADATTDEPEADPAAEPEAAETAD